jgi:antitoxin ParD1/3/4
VTGTAAKKRETRRAALAAAIVRGLADADAGRVKPASEMFDSIEAKLKAKR